MQTHSNDDTDNTAYADIVAHILANEGELKQWNAGLASQVDERGFPKVCPHSDTRYCISRKCSDARNVHNHLVVDVGCSGKQLIHIDPDEIYVFAYRELSNSL